MKKTNKNLGKLLKLTLLDRKFFIYEKQADEIDVDLLTATANRIIDALEAVNVEDKEEAAFYVSPLQPKSLCLGGPTWDFKLPFGSLQPVRLTLD